MLEERKILGVRDQEPSTQGHRTFQLELLNGRAFHWLPMSTINWALIGHNHISIWVLNGQKSETNGPMEDNGFGYCGRGLSNKLNFLGF